ncbi:MAG: hypothetical protein AAGB01_04950 [Cyanobacteria bacterium P01_F01_bin.42]
MSKRTPQTGLDDVDEVQHLDKIVFDRRGSKRAGKAKGRRRDRRYENRLLRAVDLLDDTDNELEASSDLTTSF